ncbi:MAG: hypothetical protein GDA53_04305 [Rhodobacteraceae bacterium]|nr:hypothetical protein [Paracoccaceae bacterium]
MINPVIAAKPPSGVAASAVRLTPLESESVNEISVNQKLNSEVPHPAVAEAVPDILTLDDRFDGPGADDEYDELFEEDENRADPAEELWNAAFLYKGREEDGCGNLLDDADILISRLNPQEIRNESAQWEGLLDLDLQEEEAERPVALAKEETTADDRQLDEYAATLVSRMWGIRLGERTRLHGRFRAILAEFPFSASYRALLRLISAGNSFEEVEEACDLKCLWRESPWLWSHRRFNRMQWAWEISERSTYRSALSWNLAVDLIRQVGRVEAERRLYEDWLNEWLHMQPVHIGGDIRPDPGFWSYPAFLRLNRFNPENAAPADSDAWYYKDPVKYPAVDSLPP